jgi:hypothetical protein
MNNAVQGVIFKHVVRSIHALFQSKMLEKPHEKCAWHL